MNPIDPREHEDIEGSGAVSRAYRDARGDGDMLPPPAMDDAIRAAARRAVKSGPQPAGKNWLRTWTPQLAAAAVVMLSVSVIFVSVQERPELAPAPSQSPSSPVAEVRQQVPAEKNIVMEARVQESVSPAARSNQAGALADRANTNEKDAGTIVAVPAPQSASNAASKPAEPSYYAKKEKADSVPPPEVTIEAARPAKPAPNAPPVYAPPAPPALAAAAPASAAPSAAAPATKAGAVPFPGTPSDSATSLRKQARAEANVTPEITEKKALEYESSRARGSLDRKDIAAAPVVPAPAPAPAPASAPTQAANAQRASPAAPAPARAPAPAPAMAVPSPAIVADKVARANKAEKLDITGSSIARESQPSTAGAPPAKFAAGGSSELPGPWLKRLLELREQGKLKELREELVRFKKAYPEFVLPPSLKTLSDLPAD
ncbi:MAG: hypothetical protein ABI905_11330 [Betaproteobacteria bacterium]